MAAKSCGVNCDEGRKIGCKTYCCRLLVRLTPEEMLPTNDGSISKGFIDKDEDGYCMHFDRNNFNCAIWNKRPEICRKYDCNTDYLLQIAIRKSFNNIVDLTTLANTVKVEKEDYILIPYSSCE
ncbi:hypothetical protein MNBD_GAMMA08-1503 [hydrothermal vent metagenome]|uniref:Zinc/iron-chelating domain-containing protein n=1 Tax=hydrothermal vent metagenome TaxID=652676 RepID=A0A3B0WS14_9ZZZZ